MSIQETGFTVDSTTVTVKVTGYDAYKGYYLILTTGSVRTNGDDDSRDRIGSQKYTGSDTYTFTIPAGNSPAVTRCRLTCIAMTEIRKKPIMPTATPLPLREKR